MSISSALTNALSGLTANSGQAQVVSANIANALTPGYAARSMELSARAVGGSGGVAMQGVVRRVDPGLLSARRGADAELADIAVRAGFQADLEQLAGGPDQPDSLTGRLAALQADLVTAAAAPEDETRLQAVVQQAGTLADKLNDMSQSIQQWRSDAEAGIEQAVSSANVHLHEVHALNLRISEAASTGRPTAGFEDQRRVALDQLAELVPFRLATRDHGAVAIYTTDGAVLLDSRPAELGFQAVNAIVPHMTVENGLLNGLTLNGRAIAPPSGGGRIAGLFELRDEMATDAQAQLDALARDLVERMQDPALDPTRAPGDAGLFTDAGATFDPADETGLAQRISLNAQVDPDAGGAVWRLRDRLYASAPGDSGQASLLHDLSAALDGRGALASGELGATERSFSGHAATLVSRIGQDRLSLDQNMASTAAQQAGLLEAEQAMGVDTDAEMQHLLLIEQAYTANARVIEVIGGLIDELLGI
ncbi:flagellar hook-associated protein FlgK [Roseovarius amoyensis]|uniref:flagellar hook-associated protein FlgK n=1 Tax=Roseovarius amoyensis TaxID=2211448 RepID=UPI000DBE2E9D|nr:flagellar hook-associated protein FlgK [Roseovarius amoyensis]